jgi:hypothetical protein
MWPIALFMAWLLTFFASSKTTKREKIPKSVKILVVFFVSVILAWGIGGLFTSYLDPNLILSGREIYFVFFGILGVLLGLVSQGLARYLEIV